MVLLVIVVLCIVASSCSEFTCQEFTDGRNRKQSKTDIAVKIELTRRQGREEKRSGVEELENVVVCCFEKNLPQNQWILRFNLCRRQTCMYHQYLLNAYLYVPGNSSLMDWAQFHRRQDSKKDLFWYKRSSSQIHCVNAGHVHLHCLRVSLHAVCVSQSSSYKPEQDMKPPKDTTKPRIASAHTHIYIYIYGNALVNYYFQAYISNTCTDF